ncbi:MAG: hypothetical protein IKZ39_02805 [Lachnospiraceae bacterium]|nr:hypothetical protein [Lachnospiraceae bacterium]
MSGPIDDIREVMEAAKRGPGFVQPLDDIRYFLTLDKHGMPRAVKMAVTNLFTRNEAGSILVTDIHGCVFEQADERIILHMPYPTFRTMRELREYYKLQIERL